MRENLNKIAKATFVALVGLALWVPAALAQSGGGNANYGQRAGKWALDNLKDPWKAAVAAAACMFLFPGARKPSIIGGYLLAVFVTGLVIFAPDIITHMITNIGNRIGG